MGALKMTTTLLVGREIPTYRVTIVHNDYDTIEELEDLILSTMNGFEGVNSGNDIKEIRAINSKDGFSDELERFLRYIDFKYISK